MLRGADGCCGVLTKSVVVVVLCGTCVPAAAGQLAVEQHGARGVAEAGALTAGVADPAAVAYNPAALVRLGRFEVQIGFDRHAPVDKYSDPKTLSGRLPQTYRSDHPATWPPAIYAAYTARRPVRWAVGVGVDAPAWEHLDRPATYYPVRLRPDLFVTAIQVHPVAAVAIDDRWSVGAGVRYVHARIVDEYDMLLDSGRNPGTFFIMGERTAEASADGWAGDVSVLFRTSVWGFGAVASTGATLNGTANPEDVRVTALGSSLTDRARANMSYLLHDASRDLGVDLPPDVRVGAWLRPVNHLRVETDVALQRWSSASWVRPREFPTCGPTCTMTLPREWRDTLSLRLGIAGDVGGGVRLLGGYGYEPSPLPPDRYGALVLGATKVIGAGFTYTASRVSFDVAYSIHERRAERRDLERYSSSNHVFAAATRMRF